MSRLYSLLLLFMFAAGSPTTVPAVPTVFVSIVPQAEFVREVAGQAVTVRVLVGPGHSPATYEPTPRQMADLSGARLFFCAGVPFERVLLPKIAGLPTPPVLAGSCRQDHPVHDHDHDHQHSTIDPHTWLDPVQAAAQVDTICSRLSELLPDQAPTFQSRAEAFKQRLHTLDGEIATRLAPYTGRRFFVFHPAYGHFARRYGLVQVAVEQAGHEPGARQLAGVIDEARSAGARVIVVQPQFSRRSAETIAKATGAEILVLDPLAGDYEANLRHIATALASALENGS